jgi:hypothetical protein
MICEIHCLNACPRTAMPGLLSILSVNSKHFIHRVSQKSRWMVLTSISPLPQSHSNSFYSPHHLIHHFFLLLPISHLSLSPPLFTAFSQYFSKIDRAVNPKKWFRDWDSDGLLWFPFLLSIHRSVMSTESWSLSSWSHHWSWWLFECASCHSIILTTFICLQSDIKTNPRQEIQNTLSSMRNQNASTFSSSQRNLTLWSPSR